MDGWLGVQSVRSRQSCCAGPVEGSGRLAGPPDYSCSELSMYRYAVRACPSTEPRPVRAHALMHPRETVAWASFTALLRPHRRRSRWVSCLKLQALAMEDLNSLSVEELLRALEGLGAIGFLGRSIMFAPWG